MAEFDLRKGLAIATFSGVMSGCFAWGLDAGQPIRDLTLAAGTDPLSQGLPVLCVVLLGGLTTNALWCAYLIVKNRSLSQFFGAANTPDAPRAPLLANWGLAALGGTLWYGQFFFYTMGESQMGAYGFSMASEYNARPLPAEVMVVGNEAKVVRRRGTMNDLYRSAKPAAAPRK